jgi:invasion protein IalB
MKLMTVLAVASAGMAAVAQAQTAAPAAAPAPAAQEQSAAQQAYDEKEIVCQKQEVTGSRLATRRVCMTRGEWMRARMADKAEIEAIQRRGDASSK